MKRPMINVSLQRYGTRMLTAGDAFEASRRDARVLVALKKAQYAGDSDADGDAEPATEAEILSALRAEYQGKFGKRPFNGWNAEEIKAKLAAAPAAS